MSPQYIPVPSPTTSMILSGVIALGLLLLLSAFLGVLGKKKWQSFDEYLVGRRDIGPLVTGAALSASYISGWAFCGSTGIVYTLGFSGMWFAGIWSLVGIIPCIWLAAMKTREFSVKLGATTVPETIGKRFESKMLQTVIAISMLFFLFMYSVGQLKAGASVWYALTGLSPLWCLLLSIFVAWLYMAMGGYVGNQYAMALQGLVFAIVGTLIGITAIVQSGGFYELTSKLVAQDPKLMSLIRPDLPKLGFTQLMSSMVGILATPVIFFTMATGFPHNVSRFLGMRKMSKKDYLLDGGHRLDLYRHPHHARLLEQRPRGKDALRPPASQDRALEGRPGCTDAGPCFRWIGHAGYVYGGPFFRSPVNPGRNGFHHERQYHKRCDQTLEAEGIRPEHVDARILPDRPLPLPALLLDTLRDRPNFFRSSWAWRPWDSEQSSSLLQPSPTTGSGQQNGGLSLRLSTGPLATLLAAGPSSRGNLPCWAWGRWSGSLFLAAWAIYFLVSLATQPPSEKTIALLFPAKK